MKRIPPSFCLLALLFCASCQRREDPNANWLVGDWIVDREKTTKVFVDETVAQLGISGETIKEKTAIVLAKATASGTISTALKLLDKVEFIFTETEYRATAGDFGGETIIYEILERPSRDEIKVRMKVKEVKPEAGSPKGEATQGETIPKPDASEKAEASLPKADAQGDPKKEEVAERIYAERLYHREGKIIWFEGDFVIGKAKIYLKRKK